MNADTLLAFVRFHAWANDRILTVAAGLSDDEFRAPSKLDHGSAFQTLRHLVDVDWSWRQFCIGNNVGDTYVWDHGFVLDDLPAIHAFCLDEDKRLRSYVGSLDDTALSESLVISGDFAAPRWLVLGHVVNHGTQHRSEVARYLTECGHSPGDLDLLDALELNGQATPLEDRLNPALTPAGEIWGGLPCAALYRASVMGQVLFVHTEADLIEAARAGDGSAFAELVRPLYQAAFRVAFGMLHDADEAEDAVQEAAFKAWKRLGNLREGASLRPWFLAIVANQCRTVSKSRWWSVLKVDPPETQGRSVDIAASVDLRRALRRLGHDERLVLVLRYYLDMPFEEIATTLGISTKAARTRVERAVRRLRPIIQNQGAAV